MTRVSQWGLPILAVLCWALGTANEAWAATARLTWERPTTYANGEPVPPDLPLEYRVWWGRESRGSVTSPEEWRYPKVRITQATRFTVTSLPTGRQTCFAVTARDKRTGEESDYSNELCQRF
jgi:hypothetical protein